MIRKFLLFLLLLSANYSTGFAQQPLPDFKPEQVTFDFLSSDGSFWHDCNHRRGSQPHSWEVKCDRFEFRLHMFMSSYSRGGDTTYEFHYWADEVTTIGETHTQSTWFTIDKTAKAKRIIAYLGFQKDATQLRLEVSLTPGPSGFRRGRQKP
jgi:hypothetical protein